MKAWRVVEYDGINGAIWIASGVIALVVSLAESGATVNTSALVIFGFLVVSLGFASWIHSRLRNCKDALPEVVMGSAAVRAARIERRRGGRVVRAENRFFLAH